MESAVIGDTLQVVADEDELLEQLTGIRIVELLAQSHRKGAPISFFIRFDDGPCDTAVFAVARNVEMVNAISAVIDGKKGSEGAGA